MNPVTNIKTVPCETAPTRWATYSELTKLRVSSLVLVATAVGFMAGWDGGWSAGVLLRLCNTILGTALVAVAANALNQLFEIEHDRKMERTAGRPLPTGRLTSQEVVAFSVTAVVVGVAYLGVAVNEVAACLAAMTFLSYVFVYTPLKRTTSMCVLVGAVPGALPPVIGWAGATGRIGFEAWLLFAIVFFWQLPHFAAIAWQYRDDYARAGYPMLAVVDKDGTRTSLHVVTHSVALIIASLLPALYGVSGVVYGLGAVALGMAFLACGVWFVVNKSSASARVHVIASIVYLPLLLALLLIDKV